MSYDLGFFFLYFMIKFVNLKNKNNWTLLIDADLY